MPDTPGKRQRREVKAKRRQAKDDRRAARHERRDEPYTWLADPIPNDFGDLDEAVTEVSSEETRDSVGPATGSEGS